MKADRVVTYGQVGDVTVAAIEHSDLTSLVEDDLRTKIWQLQQSDHPALLVLDLSRMTFLGSVGVTFLLGLRKLVADSSGRLALACVGEFCRGILRVCGLEKTFDLHDSVPEACEALQGRGSRIAI